MGGDSDTVGAILGSIIGKDFFFFSFFRKIKKIFCLNISKVLILE